jgi:gluconolactonase
MTLLAEVVEVIDRRLIPLINGTVEIEKLYDGCRWSEGPVWMPAANQLVWSDIPNSRMMRWVPGGAVSVFRTDSNYSNGNTLDREGRLVTCEHGTRRVTRTESDGSITVIADGYKGKRFNSPNDVVVKSDGSVWFTDPHYGIMSDYEGHKAEREQAGNFVYRVDAQRGRVTVVADDFVKPNGLAFSPDESMLYIADSAISHDPDGPSHIRAFKVSKDGTLKGGKVFATTDGIPDGFRVDVDGNVWTSAGAGINIYAPSGDMLGRIRFPQNVANLCFGGPKRNRIFVACTHELYSFYVTTNGI